MENGGKIQRIRKSHNMNAFGICLDFEHIWFGVFFAEHHCILGFRLPSASAPLSSILLEILVFQLLYFGHLSTSTLS